MSRLRHQVNDLQTQIDDLRPRVHNHTISEAFNGLGIQRRADQLLNLEGGHDPVQGDTDNAADISASMLAERNAAHQDNEIEPGENQEQHDLQVSQLIFLTVF